jgi:hypothetical protein
MLDFIYSFCIHCEFLLFINSDRFLVVIVIYLTKSHDITNNLKTNFFFYMIYVLCLMHLHKSRERKRHQLRFLCTKIACASSTCKDHFILGDRHL